MSSIKSAGSKTTVSSTQRSISLARRLLFPNLPLTSPLPPLLSAGSTPSPDLDALNAEMYDFIALSMRGFVNPWWTKITARDRDFIVHISRIMTHVIHALEMQLMAADLTTLVARDIPALITQHYSDYREAAAKLNSSLSGGYTRLPQLFHQLQPHIAVSAEGVVSETYVRQAIEHIMRVCLPAEDWDSVAERTIVREVLMKIVVNNSIPRITQPWFIQKTATEILETPNRRLNPTVPGAYQVSTAPGVQTLVIFILSSIQAISGLCLSLISLFQSTLHLISTVNSTPRQLGNHPEPAETGGLSESPNLARPGVDMMAEVLTTRTRAIPSAILTLVELLTGLFGPFLDRLIPHIMATHLFTIPLMMKLLSQSKKSLFPNGYPGPPPVEPTSEEKIIIREQLELRLVSLAPTWMGSMIFGSNLETRRQTISDIIDPLSSPECNAHLVVLLLDLLLITLFPELGGGAVEVEDTSAGAVPLISSSDERASSASASSG